MDDSSEAQGIASNLGTLLSKMGTVYSDGLQSYEKRLIDCESGLQDF